METKVPQRVQKLKNFGPTFRMLNVGYNINKHHYCTCLCHSIIYLDLYTFGLIHIDISQSAIIKEAIKEAHDVMSFFNDKILTIRDKIPQSLPSVGH